MEIIYTVVLAAMTMQNGWKIDVSVRDKRGTADVASALWQPRILITPRRSLLRHQIHEFWLYRELLIFFVWRNLKVRYAQTVLGASWAILQPILTALILALVLGRFAGMSTDGAPYFLFYMTALVPWTFFSGAVTAASSSLLSNQNLLQKVYFPRLSLPIAAVMSSMVDLTIGLICLFAAMALWGIRPTPSAVFLIPLLLLSAAMAATGIGVGMAALNLQYRDVAHAMPFMLQIILYASPVLYSVSSVPAEFRPFFALNPLVEVIHGLRSVVLRTSEFSFGSLLTSLGVSAAILVGGVLYFERVERRFADFA